MDQHILCIAGAHRSGTSLLARLLHHCGLYLGPEDEMMPAQADNPDGFWENLRFVELNDELLRAVGGAWDLPPWQDEHFAPEAIAPIHAKAQLLVERFRQSSAWGWKDPRNSLTLPFWRQLLPELKVLIVVRNPLEVAYSMHRRNGTSYALGLRLWEIYNRRVLAHTKPESRLITSYSTFFEEPERELRKLAAFAGLPDAEVANAAQLIAKERRHTSFTLEQLIDAGGSTELVTLYRRLTEEEITSSTDAAPREPDRLLGSGNKIDIRIPEAEDTRQELAARRGAELQHREEVARYQLVIDELRNELAAKSVKAAAELNYRDGRIEELQKAYAHLDSLLVRERDHLQQATARGAELLVELERVRDRFNQTNQLLQSLSTQLSSAEDRNTTLINRLRKQLIELKKLLRIFQQVEEAANHLRHSRRWQLANPFAALRAAMTGRPVEGFGHLDKNIDKFHAWRSNRPELETLDQDIQSLRSYGLPAAAVDLPSKPSATDARPKPPPPTKPIAFATSEACPEVSIVIPVFNQLEYTLACLASVQEHSGPVSYEVIVVDDCSTDSTREVISKIPGMTYLRSEKNSGFIASCNRGSEAARGSYLVFLNNDTTVTTGWLGALRETFATEAEAGLVGSKLIYPDGRLQEAGGIIWRDGSGWNRGKFKDPADPEYSYLREVDYCSAASIMVPRQLFERQGRFDLKYSPGYYEDTDLAFKVVAAGLKVLYQPLSVVVHYEGITGGTDVSTGAKKYQEINREKFVATWEAALATKPENGDLASFYAPHAGTKKILVIDHHLPMADRDSGSLRMFQILTILHRLGHQVTFLPDNLADIPPYGDSLRKRGIQVVHHPYVTSVEAYLMKEGPTFDAVILSRCDFARKHVEHVRRHAPQSRLIFDTVDLHFLRTIREAEVTQDAVIAEEARDQEQAEYALIDRADETWVVSTAEQKLLARERPGARVHIVSNIVDTPGSATPFASRKGFLFIGSFQHTPNIDAVLYFAREVYPQIRAELPSAKFFIIGDKAPPAVVALADENVVVTGPVPDARPYFDTVKLSVAPLRYGAGVKGKINQSMGLGVPVVATSIAAEGMHLTDRQDVMIADDPITFARAVLELYANNELWQRISEAGVSKTESAFSVATAERQLRRLFSQTGDATANADATAVRTGASLASV